MAVVGESGCGRQGAQVGALPRLEERERAAQALLGQIRVERVPGGTAEDAAGVEGRDPEDPRDRSDCPGPLGPARQQLPRMASAKKMDDNNYTNSWKKGGKATITSKVMVSADGKTMTITQTGTNGKGEAVNNVVVYTKQ